MEKLNLKLKFDYKFLCELHCVLKRYFAQYKLKSICLLMLIIFFTIVTVRGTVALNKFNQDFFNALQSFNTQSILKLSLQLCLIISIIMFSIAYSSYLTGLLSIRWRQLATDKYVKRWLSDKKYHYIKQNSLLDNPDQRIANDLDQFPDATLLLFSFLLSSVLTICSFGYTLWSASLPLKFGQLYINIPGFFCLIALFIAFLGTAGINFIGRKLPQLDYSQQKYNATYRSKLIRIQEASEEIAFFNGEITENERLNKSFDSVIKNALTINKIKKRLTFFSNGYMNVGLVVGWLIATPFYLNKQMNMGQLMLVSGAFTYTINAFSLFVSCFQSLTTWRATVHRIAELDECLDERPFPASHINIEFEDRSSLVIRDLTVATPQSTILFSGINFELFPGCHYLLKGAVGTGKSTLLRVLAGIWHHGQGSVIFPKSANVFFLPQKPYLFEGTLASNLMYPYVELPHQDLINALNAVKLGTLSDCLYASQEWGRVLSLGQQQLLGFARLLLTKPSIIFLDESTSALDEMIEAYIYSYVKASLPNAIILSVGHRHSLDTYHETKLCLTTSSLVIPADTQLRVVAGIME